VKLGHLEDLSGTGLREEREAVTVSCYCVQAVEDDFEIPTMMKGNRPDRSLPKGIIRRLLVHGVCHIMLLGQRSEARRTLS